METLFLIETAIYLILGTVVLGAIGRAGLASVTQDEIRYKNQRQRHNLRYEIMKRELLAARAEENK